MKILFKNKKIIIFFIFITIILLISYFINYDIRDDGMKNIKDLKILYKTTSKSKSFSNWKQYGILSGNNKSNDYITKIKLKTNGDSNKISYAIFNKEWGEYGIKDNYNNQKIYGLRIDVYHEYLKRYNICYRTHNKKDKWLGWTCNGETSGNKKYPINGIQVKIIPKNSVLKEYLKDYNIDKPTSKNFD